MVTLRIDSKNRALPCWRDEHEQESATPGAAELAAKCPGGEGCRI